MTSSRRQNQHGFALLLIFLMAAVIGITLYNEIPRVAFESQRQKELMLIERGEQYKRGIQLFVKKNSRYPARIEELESFNNQRYLRRRYKDPITGKDEWRLIRVGPGGVFIDSLTNKPKTGKEQQTASVNTFIGEGPPIGSTASQGQQAVNPAMRRRSSEGGTPTGTVLGPDGQPVQPQPSSATTGIAGVPGAPGLPGVTPLPGQGLPGQPMAGQGVPGQVLPGQNGQIYPAPGMQGQVYPQPGISGQPYPGQPYPGQAYPGQGMPGQVPGQPQYPGQIVGGRIPGTPGTGTQGTASGSSSSFVGGSQPYVGGGSFIGGSASGSPQTNPGSNRYPGMPGAPVNSQTGGVSPYSTAPGAQGSSPQYPQPGMNVTNPSNAAVNLIQQILTSPRTGGMPGANAGMQGLNIGPGIAGVASTSEDEAILVYNERTKYNEWEFIYDPTKEKRVANPNGGVVGTPASQMGSSGTGTQPGTQPGMQPGGQQPNSPFGTSSGFSGFGNSGFGGSSPGSTQPQTGFGRP